MSQVTLKAISKRQTKKNFRNADYFVIIDLRILLLKFTINAANYFKNNFKVVHQVSCFVGNPV